MINDQYYIGIEDEKENDDDNENENSILEMNTTIY